jgi:inhibitor of cysteine peptidase
VKNILLIFLFGFAFLINCSSTETENNYTKGTVKFLSFEGGFYGIVTDAKKNLDPLNLPKEFQVDGKRVMFRYIEKKDMASFHMWGIIVEILEIKELKE